MGKGSSKMQVKNIEVFQPTPITVKVGGEEIKIEKIPAMATLLFYKDKEKDGTNSNLVAEILTFGTIDQSNQNEMIAAAKQMFVMYENYQDEINKILQICMKKNQQWIDNHLDLSDITRIISVICTQVIEQLSFIKKNELTTAEQTAD
jgi:hypothetical protein